MLRLVDPPPGGNGTDPPARRRGRSPALSFTPDEARHLRAAIRNTARAYGSTECLAAALEVPVKTLYQALAPKRRASGLLAIRIARAAGMALEAIIGGKLTDAGRCPTCGARAGDGRLVAGGAS